MVNSISKTSPQEHQHALLQLLAEFDRVCKVLDLPYVLFAGTMLGAVRHQGFIPWDDDLDVLMMRKDYETFLAKADTVLNQETFFLQKEFSEHWPMFFSKLRLNGTVCLEKYHPKDEQTHHGVYMDIFPCDNAFESGWARKLQFWASKVVIAKSLYKRGYETNSRMKKVFMQICKVLPTAWFLKITGCGKENSTYVHTFLGGASLFDKSVYPRCYLQERTEMLFGEHKYPIPAAYDDILRILYGEYMTIPSPEERIVKQHVVLVDLHSSYENYRELHKKMKFETHTRSIR